MALLAKIDPNLALICLDAGIARNPGKNLKVGGFETDFKQVPFVFRQTTWTAEAKIPAKNLEIPTRSF